MKTKNKNNKKQKQNKQQQTKNKKTNKTKKQKKTKWYLPWQSSGDGMFSKFWRPSWQIRSAREKELQSSVTITVALRLHPNSMAGMLHFLVLYL